jgi:DNA-binding LytR/AlgR family response regulator
MENYNILLVDDEYLALNLLEEFLSRVPGMEVIGKCKSPIDALQILQQENIDILFLDIQMPTLSGVDLLKSLPQPPATVFTTAYRDYAIDAFDLNVVDYLLKPFAFERFLQALNKARSACQPTVSATKKEAYLHVKVEGKLVRIKTDDIVYVEGMKEYVRVVCPQGKYIIFERLKNIEEQLPSDQFLRVHKSYIVAKERVLSIEGNLLDVGLQRIPVSRSLRATIIETFFS